MSWHGIFICLKYSFEIWNENTFWGVKISLESLEVNYPNAAMHRVKFALHKTNLGVFLWRIVFMIWYQTPKQPFYTLTKWNGEKAAGMTCSDSSGHSISCLVFNLHDFFHLNPHWPTLKHFAFLPFPWHFYLVSSYAVLSFFLSVFFLSFKPLSLFLLLGGGC